MSYVFGFLGTIIVAAVLGLIGLEVHSRSVKRRNSRLRQKAREERRKKVEAGEQGPRGS